MAVDARCAAWWARAMPPGVRPVGGVLGVRPDGGWSTAAPRGSAGRSFGLLLVDPTSAALRRAVTSHTQLTRQENPPTSITPRAAALGSPTLPFGTGAIRPRPNAAFQMRCASASQFQMRGRRARIVQHHHGARRADTKFGEYATRNPLARWEPGIFAGRIPICSFMRRRHPT